MIRPVALISFIIAFAASAIAQPDTLVLSERIGPTIEPYEREYFGLFPRIEGFVVGTICKHSTDSVLIQSRSSELGENRSWVLPYRDFRRLQWVIDNYDSLRFSIDGDAFRRGIRPGARQSEDYLWECGVIDTDLSYPFERVAVETNGSGYYDGILLYIDPDRIFIGLPNYNYNHPPSLQQIFIIQRDSVTAIQVSRPKPVFKNILWGLGIGGIASIAISSGILGPATGHDFGYMLGVDFVIGVGGAFVGAGIGALAAAMNDGVDRYTSDEFDLQSSDLTNELSELMYYINGLPPELRKEIAGMDR